MARGGIDRAARAARWVQKEGATVSAFQEVAKDQLRHMQKSMPGYNFFPRRTLGTRGSAIQLAWKTSEVKLMATGHVMRPVPRLAAPDPVRPPDATATPAAATGWSRSTTPPAATSTERDISTADEIELIKKMLGKDRPVFVIGDVNERSEFCPKVAGATPLVSMNGGTAQEAVPGARASAVRTGCSAPAPSSPASRRSTTASATTPR